MELRTPRGTHAAITTSFVICIFLLGVWCYKASSKTTTSPPAMQPRGNRFQIPTSSPCSLALSAGVICNAANEEALRLLQVRRFAGAIVVQDVHSGALVAYASSPAIEARVGTEIRSSALGVTSPISPLSVSKVLLAASWWDHESEAVLSKACKSKACMSDAEVHEMLVSGSDGEGKRLALDLRQSVGAQKVFADLKDYGFPPAIPKPPHADGDFWGAIEPSLRDVLTPASAFVSIPGDAADADWASAFSIGETGFTVTLLHISRFLQAVGNGGKMILPNAWIQAGTRQEAGGATSQAGLGKQVMQGSTAERLQSAMLDNVQRGTATRIRSRLGDKWKIGGKTGTDSESDGVFAGLVFDSNGVPRYSFVTYIKGGGKGGGVAAEVSAELIIFILGN
jgi:Penicillin binding protein transpeptidase domain